MTARMLYFFICSAAFLIELQCASQKGTNGLTFATSVLVNSTLEASGKKDSNQTFSSRLKRKTLSVDFAVPSLLRHYMAMFIKRPLNGDCLTYNGCYTVRANLRMHCIPLQKTIASLLDTKLAAMDSMGAERLNGSSTGQLPYRHKRPMPKVLNLGLTKASRKSNQVVVEIGEDMVKAGCGGLAVYEDAPVLFLEIDLTRILEWWLGAEGGRLRVRLMPERKAQVPGKEDKYSAAIRAADARLLLQIASSGLTSTRSAGNTDTSLRYWNFSWIAEEEVAFPEDAAPTTGMGCTSKGASCNHGADGYYPEFAWSLTSAEDFWAEDHGGMETMGGNSQGWEEGRFLAVNGSSMTGPWVLSPWLRTLHQPCGLDVTLFLHPRQKGRYTVWLIERDKPPLSLLTTEPPHVTGWAVVHLSLGARAKPFRVSSSYNQPGELETATYDPLFITNCTMESSRNVTLEGHYHCRQGQEISLGQLCDFTPDCPLGDDEGEACRQFLNGSYCSFEEGDCGWQSVSSRSPYRRVHLSLPKGLRNSCPSSGAVLAVESQSKGQQGSVSVRSPLFLYPLRNAPCMVHFQVCGSPSSVLSLWIVENSTGPEGQRNLWNSTNDKMDKGWRHITFPLFGLVDSFYLQLVADISPGSDVALAVDNFTLSINCFLATNGEFPPVVPTGATQGQIRPTNQKKTPTPVDRDSGTLTIQPTPVEAMKWFFHTCGATGPDGPTPSQCFSAYRNTNVNVTVGTRGALKGIQMWRVPETGLYRVAAYGAAGGRSVLTTLRSHGVYITGDFKLRRDDVLHILVGQQGQDACPKTVEPLRHICLSARGPPDSKSMLKGGGGGGGGATYIFKVEKGAYVPLLIAAGGGGRGYSGSSKSQLEVLDQNPSIPGHNGISSAAGGGGGWNDSVPVAQGGRPLVLGGQGGEPCHAMGWMTHGGFGGGGGACMSGGGGGGYRGGSTSLDNDPTEDGKDGSSFISPEGELFVEALKGMEGDGEVIISPVQNCSHCESGECHDTLEGTMCYCDEDLILATDGVSCINSTEIPPPHQPSLSHLALALSVGTSALIAALLLAVSGVMIMYRRKHTELQSIQLELQSPDCKLSKLRASTIMTDYNPNYCFAGKTASVTDLKEVPRRNISLTRGLGHGAFGEVYEGLAVGIPGEPSPMQVAVKTLPEVCSEQDELDFLMEALIISKFSHQNIVRCIGVSLQALPRFILLELMAGGDLKTFLRETRPRLEHPSSLTMVDLLNIARDIARGCQYLEENQFIHRDIAARNCLLTCKGSGRVAKIGDFGMARDIYRASYYKKGGRAMLPVKWMPPEAFMEGIFTSKTDTWSFGVLLWEIFSLGYMPYPSRSNQEVLEFVTNGGRMDPPKNCPGPVYRIMTQSWQHQPEDRPNFSTILERIDYCLQDPDVVNVPLPVEYGPVPEEEEKVPMRPEDPASASLLVTPQGAEEAPAATSRTEEAKRAAEALLMSAPSAESKSVPGSTAQPPVHLQVHAQPTCSKPPSMPTTAAGAGTTPDGGLINLGFTQGHAGEKDSRNGKPTNLWNPTYGSWFLQQQQKRQQAQAQRQAGGQRQAGAQRQVGGQRLTVEGQERSSRTVTVAEALGLQRQHKQQQQYQQQIQQQQQQRGLCRPFLPPPAPASAPAPLLLDSAALPPVPLYRLRRFPCGNIGYGYQEQGLPLEAPVAISGPQATAAPPPHPGQQRPLSLVRASGPEDSRPLLVTMGAGQDSRLPKMEGHNATVL
ncbi:ALK tyrosine kinase receptor [Electrophorus electricus]|uniref:ALK tyrosine kinase receptor n=1 Tax=Electrophorus electricus TaxID=8005 RepID=UPI0015D02CF1|nr:ALK tyrosine kinase receptor [Electrophorus electricus]